MHGMRRSRAPTGCFMGGVHRLRMVSSVRMRACRGTFFPSKRVPSPRRAQALLMMGKAYSSIQPEALALKLGVNFREPFHRQRPADRFSR